MSNKLSTLLDVIYSRANRPVPVSPHRRIVTYRSMTDAYSTLPKWYFSFSAIDTNPSFGTDLDNYEVNFDCGEVFL
jgi:hypothetical protein